MKVAMDVLGTIVRMVATATAVYTAGVLFGFGLLTACRMFGVNVIIGCAKVVPVKPPDDSGPEPPDNLRGYYK